MTKKSAFDLQDFLPYVLNQAAEASSRGFQPFYKDRYGMFRTEWRVLFHLGRYGAMTAKDICDRASLHKTKVSRAVAALDKKRYLTREVVENDRRHETLKLTTRGQSVFDDLNASAQSYDQALRAHFSPHEQAVLQKCLAVISTQ